MNNLEKPIIDSLHKILINIYNDYDSHFLYSFNRYLEEEVSLELDGEMGELRGAVWI